MYNPGFGLFNFLLGYGPGKGPDWLASQSLAMWAVIIVDVWMWSPYVMLLCLAGLSAIPDYLYEAAEIDRAKWFYTFWRITLPQVAPLLLIAVLFRTIEALRLLTWCRASPVAGRATPPNWWPLPCSV